MERNIVASSQSSDAITASRDIIRQIEEASEGRTPLLIVFVSEYDIFSECACKLYQQYPKTTVIGSTTDVVFSSTGYSNTGIAALVIYEGIQCADGVLLDVGKHPDSYRANIARAIASFEDVKNMMCFEFCSANCKCEELVQDTIKSVHKKLKLPIPILGSTAGALEMNDPTLVSLNGEVYSEACVFVYIKNLYGKFFFYKENMFKPTEHFFRITDIDSDTRNIYEFDGKNAALALSEATGVAPKDLPEYVQMHPLGRIDGDEILITYIREIYDDGRLETLSRAYNETEVVLLEPDDIEATWEKTLEKARREIPNPSFGIAINCHGRTTHFFEHNLFGKFVDKLRSSNGSFVGVSGFGEHYMCENCNLTLVLIGFE